MSSLWRDVSVEFTDYIRQHYTQFKVIFRLYAYWTNINQTKFALKTYRIHPIPNLIDRVQYFIWDEWYEAGLDIDRGKILCPCRGSNPDRPVVQRVVRHYTAWANPTPGVPLLLFLYVLWILNPKVHKKGDFSGTQTMYSYVASMGCFLVPLQSFLLMQSWRQLDIA
jgi:hypothetical protein